MQEPSSAARAAARAAALKKEGVKRVPHQSGHGDIIGWGHGSPQQQDPTRPSRANASGQSPAQAVTDSLNSVRSSQSNSSNDNTSSSSRQLPFLSPEQRSSGVRGADSEEKLTLADLMKDAKQAGSASLNQISAELLAVVGGRPSSAGGQTADAGPARPGHLLLASTIALDAVSNRRGVYLRSLTSRLSELRTLAGFWRGNNEFTERIYIQALQRLRDQCHEWAAVDVLAALNHCNGRLAIKDDAAAADQNSDSDQSGLIWIDLVLGIPEWSYPAYPSIRWCRALMPVIESLLYSCYEDYLSVSLDTLKRAFAALDGLFQLAAECEASDLDEPTMPSIVGPASASGASAGSDNGSASRSAGAEFDGKESEHDQHQQRSLAESKEAVEATALAEYEHKLMLHTAATHAVEVVRLTQPLLGGLSSASQNPGPAAKVAVARARRLQELHELVRHLTTAAAFTGE